MVTLLEKRKELKMKEFFRFFTADLKDLIPILLSFEISTDLVAKVHSNYG